MNMKKSDVDTVLSALGEQLEYAYSEPIEIVICGGSALQVLGLIDRATRDIDVLAFVCKTNTSEPNLISAEPLPTALVEAAALVARDFSLPNDWLNPGPTDLLSQGLPEGLEKRLHTRNYGSALMVHFIDRLDQIFFKTYAAINGGDARHLSDLRLLEPTDEEMFAAAEWCLTQDASDVFPELVRSFLRQVGYERVAEGISKTDQG